MFKFIGDYSDGLNTSSEALLDDSVVSFISKVGIDLPTSNETDEVSQEFYKTIFNLTKKKK